LIPGASLPNHAAGPFKISDLKPYLGKEDELESRATPLQEGEDDEDMDVFPSEIPPGLPPELPPDFRVSPTYTYNEWTDNTIACTIAKSPGTFYPSQLCFGAYAWGHGCFDD
jgi:hypothetical protein